MDYSNQVATVQYQGFLTRGKCDKQARLLGVPIYSLDEVDDDIIFDRNGIQYILFPDYSSTHMEEEWLSSCLAKGIKLLVSPPLEGMDGKVQYHMRPIQFEDLLGREEITINEEKIGIDSTGRTILITGAAGSIGSELVRQLIAFSPAKIIMLDVAETPLHNLRIEMESHHPNIKSMFAPIIGDVRSIERLEYVFRRYHPDVVYHAAAYKHVPLMEENPCEAVLDNVRGTKNLVDVSVKYNVKSFVMISTDKAVNPTNVMGASKRVAEIYVQSTAKLCEKQGLPIRFVTTRFGNVLGSNGSVIPFFKNQIENGGPVTVTHPDIIRYIS